MTWGLVWSVALSLVAAWLAVGLAFRGEWFWVPPYAFLACVGVVKSIEAWRAGR